MSEERETCQDTIARYYAEGGEGAGQLGAPTIMRAGAVRVAPGHVVMVAWTKPFITKSAGIQYFGDYLLMPGMPISALLGTAVRVTNIDAVLQYLKTALKPRPGTSARFIYITPIVPGTGTIDAPARSFGAFVSETAFMHALKMLGIPTAMVEYLPGGAGQMAGVEDA